jgi:hypothetical protein
MGSEAYGISQHSATAQLSRASHRFSAASSTAQAARVRTLSLAARLAP